MWLQLTAGLLATGAMAAGGDEVAGAALEGDADVRVDVYSDDWITVVSPTAAGTVRTPGGLSVRADVAVDFLSGATPVLTTDAMSSATRFEETRTQAGVAATWTASPALALTASYTTSQEPDFETHAVGLGWSGEVLERMATLQASYHVSFEEVGLAYDEAFGERGIGHQINLSWTHILGRETTLTTQATGQLVTCGPLLGCHANAYRYVAIGTADGKGALLTARERHPDTRGRGAAALRLSQHLGGGVALHVGYRFYGDTWRVVGGSADLGLARGFFADRLVVWLVGRFSHQTAASFWRTGYGADPGSPEIPRWRTADRELTGLLGGRIGLVLEWTSPAFGPVTGLRITGRLARHFYRYPDYRPLPERDAWVGGGGIGARF